MSNRNEPHCISCDVEIREDGRLQSLPFSHSKVDIVDNNYEGEWVGLPACRGCFDVHAVVGARGLQAHVEATTALRNRLEKTQDALYQIQNQVIAHMERLGL